MIQSSEQEQKQQKLVLPPVQRNKRHQSLSQILTLVTEKKYKYQRQLQKQQPSNQQYNLQYGRYNTLPNEKKSGERYNQMVEEEHFARGGIIDNSFYSGLVHNKKNTLQTNSTLQYINENSQAKHKVPDLPINKNSYKSIHTQQKNPLTKKKEYISSLRQRNHFQTKEKEDLHNEQNETKRVYRIKTLANQRQKSQPNESITNASFLHKQKSYIQTFKDCICDLKRGSKTNQRLQKTVKSLQCFNPFFRKIQRVIGVCLLRMGRIRQKQPNSTLYDFGETYTHFNIILLGQIKITGRNGMHKICETGQTLLQEILLTQQSKPSKVAPITVQKAKVMEQSWLLQIQKQEMHKLQKQLNRFGFKQGLRQMKTLIKRNSIVKNWLRNKFTIMKKH